MRQHRFKRVKGIIRTHGDEADVELAQDFVWKDDVDFHIEGTLRHFYLKSFGPDRLDVFFIDVHESDLVAGARQPAADNATDRSCANDDHAHDCEILLRFVFKPVIFEIWQG